MTKMSLSIFSVVSRNLGRCESNFLLPCNWKQAKFGYISSAGITSKANRDPNYKRKPPFPYKEKKYTFFRSLIDRTSERLDENSKIVVVDGPLAVGKSNFAKSLAEELDMHYLPEANMDMVYINSYGFDERSLNDRLSPNLQRTDEKSFCLDPYQLNSASLQFSFFELRFSMYLDALAHVMNTGQGVVMVRSVYSDMVFAEAMAKVGYIRKQVLNAYYTMRNEIFSEILRPHLQIYLDIPVSVVQERIKARGKDWEINSKALTPAYLEAIEDMYKRKFLPQIEEHAELLIYDWSEFGDLELITEDIERLNFEKYTVYDKKMSDWRFPKEPEIAERRMTYTDYKQELITMLDIPMFDCPELYTDPEDEELEETILKQAPGRKYIRGYNEDMGDKSILFKTRVAKPDYPHFN